MTDDNADDANSQLSRELIEDSDNQTTKGREDDPDSSEEISSSKCRGDKRELDTSDSDVDSEKKKKRVVTRSDEESSFIELCTKAERFIGEILDKSDDDVQEGKGNVISAFTYSEGGKYSDLDFKEPANLVGYFVRHGPTSAGVARYKVSKILKKNEDLQNELQNLKNPIKILDLGTGHGCGIVGLFSALNQYLEKKIIRLTLVDNVEEWIPVFNMVESLLRLGKFGQSSAFLRNNWVSTTYLLQDLSKDAPKRGAYKRSLDEADIIILSRVLSIAGENYVSIARNVVDGMKIGALLFFLDAMGFHGNPEAFNKLQLLSSSEEEDYQFRGSWSLDNFHLSKTCKAKMFVYRKIY